MNNFNIPEWEKNTTGDTACEKLSKNVTKLKKRLKPGKKARTLEKLAKSAALSNKQNHENKTFPSDGRDFDGEKAKRKKNKLKNKRENTTNGNLPQNLKNPNKNLRITIGQSKNSPKKKPQKRSEANGEQIFLNNQSNSSENVAKKRKEKRKISTERNSEADSSNSTANNSNGPLENVKKRKREKSIEITGRKLINGDANPNNLTSEGNSPGNVKKRAKKKRQKSTESPNNSSNSQEKLPKKQKNRQKTAENNFLTNNSNNPQEILPKKQKKRQKSIESNSPTSNSQENLNKKQKKRQKSNLVEANLANKITSENILTNNLSNPSENAKQKKKKRKKLENSKINNVETAPIVKRLQSPKKRAANAKLADKLRGVLHSEPRGQSLRQRMMEKLKGAHFRLLNEEMYTKEGKDAAELFKKDPTAFDAYHDGYRQQVARWPLNPLDNVIASIKRMSKNHVIADFGCGEGRLSKSVEQKVHSFDLVAANETVTACDMSHVPLQNNSVDVAVFCLSLMGTNLNDFLLEANRVLKIGGILKIAEVESRFDTVETFIQGVEHYGFKNTWKDFSHNLFHFLDFKKESNSKKKNKLPTISLHPCLYKKR